MGKARRRGCDKLVLVRGRGRMRSRFDRHLMINDSIGFTMSSTGTLGMGGKSGQCDRFFRGFSVHTGKENNRKM